jgi:hypothetical protein
LANHTEKVLQGCQKRNIDFSFLVPHHVRIFGASFAANSLDYKVKMFANAGLIPVE